MVLEKQMYDFYRILLICLHTASIENNVKEYVKKSLDKTNKNKTEQPIITKLKLHLIN